MYSPKYDGLRAEAREALRVSGMASRPLVKMIPRRLFPRPAPGQLLARIVRLLPTRHQNFYDSSSCERGEIVGWFTGNDQPSLVYWQDGDRMVIGQFHFSEDGYEDSWLSADWVSVGGYWFPCL